VPTKERYEPLPPVTRLPGLLWSRLGRVGRALAIAAGLALVAAIIVLAPKIADTKESNAARDRREAAEARESEIARLQELVRPRTGTTDTPANPRADLERQITTDARGRPDVNRVLRTQCTAIPGGEGRYSCTAVTSDLPGGEVSREGSIGFPYRAIAAGRELTWCRIAGSPGEGSNKGKPLVAIPARCGG
jgi:hypothetical protein